MKSYLVTKADEIVLYGCGKLGHKQLQKFRDAGYNPVAFFDMRAAEISIQTVMPVVYPFDDKIKVVYKDAVVVICYHDYIQHEVIAKRLYESGYTKVIFMPKELFTENEKKMAKVYNQITKENVKEKNEIPFCQSIIEKEYNFSDAIIRIDKNKIIAWVPWEIVYYENPKTGAIITHDYVDRCIGEVKMISDMFDYISTGEGNFEEYYEYIGRFHSQILTDITKVIDNRRKVYLHLSKKLELGVQEFCKMPVEVEWNANGHFNILDGHHRAVFLFMNGYTKIPSLMTEEDFQKWCNVGVANNLMEYLRNRKIVETITPVPNPLFFRFDSSTEGFGKKILAEFMRIMDKMQFNNCSIVDISLYNSYFARGLSNKGEKICAIQESQVEFDISDYLNKLLYIDKVKIYKDEITNVDQYGEFQIIFMLCSLGEYIKKGREKELLQSVDQAGTKILFWQSRENPEKEKELITKNTKFKKYEKICSKYKEQYISEIGAFYAE